MTAVAVVVGLCVAGSAAAQVYSYQATLGVTGVPGTDNAHFSGPNAGGIDPVNGHYFIGDVLNQRVQVFDTADNSYVATLGTTGITGTDNAHFNEPGPAYYDSVTDQLLVPDSNNARIQAYNAKTFAYVSTIGVSGVVGADNGHFNVPIGVRVNPTTRQLFVADSLNHRVQVFDAATFAYITTLGVSGVSGSDNEHFNTPYDVEFDPLSNQMLVADYYNARVQFFDANTLAYVGTIGGLSADPSNNFSFKTPNAIAYDPTSRLILVGDTENDRVQVFDANTILTSPTLGYVMTLGTTDSIGTSNSQFEGPFGIAVDSTHGRIIVGDASNDRVQIYQINPSPIGAAVLPGSRSVEVGATATIYATMLNSSASSLSNCQIALPADAPAGLSLTYQTTDPATNALTGAPNTPATIPGNDGSQSFVASFRGAAPVNATGMALDYSCGGQAPAAAVPGVDTVDLTLSSTPVPDIIALAATPSNNGIVEILAGGAGAFAVATDNLGVVGAITASVDTGSVSLPLTPTICESNPSTGACLGSPAASVTLTYAAGATPTFSVFVASTGTAVPLDPASSRIFVRFKDTANGLHGSTSVAVETK